MSVEWTVGQQVVLRQRNGRGNYIGSIVRVAREYFYVGPQEQQFRKDGTVIPDAFWEVYTLEQWADRNARYDHTSVLAAYGIHLAALNDWSTDDLASLCDAVTRIRPSPLAAP